MKNIFKVLVLAVVVLVSSCSSDDDSNVNDPGLVSHEVTIDMSLGLTSRAAYEPDHNYVYDGYDISFTGTNLVNGDVNLTNQNLQDYSISLQVTGDIKITVSHPDFVGNETTIMTTAYYGIEDLNLPTADNTNVTADLILVQGFTVITAINGAESLVDSQFINDIPVTRDVTYYTAATDVVVRVETKTAQTIAGHHETVLGEGAVYVIDAPNGIITLELPEFADPIDGDFGDTIKVTTGKFVDYNGDYYSADGIKVSTNATEAELQDYLFAANVSKVLLITTEGTPIVIDSVQEGQSLYNLINENIGAVVLKQDFNLELYNNNTGTNGYVEVNLNIVVIY